MNPAALLALLGVDGMAGARLAEAVETDLIALRDIVQGALRTLMKLAGSDDPWPYVVALYSESVIVELDGKTWRYPYTVVEGGVTFGTREQVVRAFVPAKDAAPPAKITPPPSAAASGVLIEAIDGNDAKPKSFRVRVIRAGRSLNGNYYPDAVLKEAVPLFEGCRVFVKSDMEHIAHGGKDIRNLVGALSQISFIEGATPDSGEVHAVLTLIVGEDEPIAVRLREAVSQGLSHLFGLSIDALGIMKPGGTKGNQTAKAFKLIKSVDLIVEPGAGGQVISFVEAVENGDLMTRAEIIALIQSANPALLEGKDITTITDAELSGILTDALKAKPATEATTTPAAAAAGTAVAEAVAGQLRMRELVSASKLPLLARQKIITEFTMSPASFTEALVIERIKNEIAYLTEASGGNGHVYGLGEDAFIQVGEGRTEKMNAMFDAFFDPTHKDHKHARSFKECYVEFTGDRLVTGHLRDATRLTEALDSTSFGDVLGDSITRRMLADYRTVTDLDIWKLVANIAKVDDFRKQERTRYGGYGDLPTVAESGPYTALTSPSDEAAEYAVSKFGGIETITLEMIKNDDASAIQRIPIKLSRAAKRTLCKFVLGFFTSSAAIYDTKTLFHLDHGNLGSAALSENSWFAARLAMMKQAEQGSNEQLGIGPKHLLIAADLEKTAYDLFQRSTNQDKTFVQSLMPNLVPVPFWTDPNDWVAVADPLDIPGIEIGFLDGNQEPELFVQDTPTSGSMFSNDKMTHKIRHTYGGTVTDFRAFYKSVIANS